VKCDEEQPSCQRCVKSGRVCSYPGPFRPVGQLRTIVPRPSLNAINHSNPESMALDFFRRATVHQLPCASAFEMPWERIVLDLVHQQPSIAAAASACASLHRAVSDMQDQDQQRFALQQQNKSLGLVRRYINDLSAESTDADVLVVLVACLLFFTYEAFSGQDAKASLHLRTGLRVIHERRCPPGKPRTSNDRHIVVTTSKPQSLFDVLVQTFIRLDSDYTLTGHDDPQVALHLQNLAMMLTVAGISIRSVKTPCL
jgi:hypothetical protein